ncbi:MAG TPA: FecR domain-containing protein, partial [Polyangiaceae bacterium]
MTEPKQLAAYVQPRLTEARIHAQWVGIAERQPRARAQRIFLYAGGLAAAIVLVVLGLLAQRRSSTEPLSAQLTVERDAQGDQRTTFPEGLSVTLKGDALYRVSERSSKRVQLVLERGAAEFDVTPARDRKVVVTAAGFDVEVVGTHFEVALLGETSKPDVVVRVQRGTVKVRPRGAGRSDEVIRTLSAGDSWATRTDFTGTPLSGPVLPANSAVTAPEVDAPPSVASASSPRPVTAKELFETAQSSRIQGRPREAAAALDRLRHGFPSDPRAGLSSFELGRLRMDQLGDPAGALNAFADAIRLDPSARFREDAQARIVQIYDGLGQSERCRTAQREYQSRYPSG